MTPPSSVTIRQPATSVVPAIAFGSNRAGSPSIYVANADGTGVTHLVRGKAPAWSHDGSRIAYYSDGDIGEPPGIYVINSDGSQERFLAPAVGQDAWGGPGLSWGPGDREIAYRGDHGIFVIATDGSTPARKLIDDDLVLPRPDGWSADDYLTGWVQSPVWSPDGNQIAFLRVDPYNADAGAFRNIYVIDADGSNPRLLGRSCPIPPPGAGSVPCPVESVAWSPLGERLAVASYDIDPETGGFDAALGIMPPSFGSRSADSLDVLYRSPLRYVGNPEWSPDGSAIIFSAFPDTASIRGPRILVLSLDSGTVTQLIPEAANPGLTPYADEHPVWRGVNATRTGYWDY